MEYEILEFLIPLMVIIVSVTFFLFLGEKIKISAISIQLLLGIIIGNLLFDGNLLPKIGELHWLQFLGDFGFILLMFLAGLELNVLFLRRYFSKSIILVICVFTLSLVAGLSVGLLLELQITAAVLVGIVVGGASIGIVFPILHELGLSQKRLGQILIAATMVLDIISIVIISLINLSATGTFKLTQFIIVILIVVGFFLIIFFGIGPFWNYFEGRIPEVKALEWEIRITFAIIMVLAVVTGYFLEIQAIIGAFLAGMIMGQSKSAQRLEEKIGSIGYGFFIPVFFFVIGMHVKLTYFTDTTFILTLIIFIAVIFAVKLGSSVLSSKIMKLPWKTGLIMGFIMIPSLSVGIHAAELGYPALFSDYHYSLLIAIIVVSSIIIPLLTRSMANRLIPELVTKTSAWHIHLEHDLGIYLDDYYHNVFDEVKIEELPTKQYIRIHPQTAIITILGFMEKYHQMNFPVVSDENKLIGIVDFDEVKANIVKNNFEGTAKSIMREELIYLKLDETLGSALNKMKEHTLELLPVVDNELNFLKNITEEDLLRFVRIRALGASISPEEQEYLSKKRIWKKEE